MKSFSYAPIHLYVLRYGTFSSIIQYKGGLSGMEFSILYLETGVSIENASNFACKILKYL